MSLMSLNQETFDTIYLSFGTNLSFLAVTDMRYMTAC